MTPSGQSDEPGSAAAAGGTVLAPQGGSGHGAFTWGALDHLLEAGKRFDAVRGVSAGAMRALAAAAPADDLTL